MILDCQFISPKKQLRSIRKDIQAPHQCSPRGRSDLFIRLKYVCFWLIFYSICNYHSVQPTSCQQRIQKKKALIIKTHQGNTNRLSFEFKAIAIHLFFCLCLISAIAPNAHKINLQIEAKVWLYFKCSYLSTTTLLKRFESWMKGLQKLVGGGYSLLCFQ